MQIDVGDISKFENKAGISVGALLVENPAKLTPVPQSLLRLIQCGGKGSRVVVSPSKQPKSKIGQTERNTTIFISL